MSRGRSRRDPRRPWAWLGWGRTEGFVPWTVPEPDSSPRLPEPGWLLPAGAPRGLQEPELGLGLPPPPFPPPLPCPPPQTEHPPPGWAVKTHRGPGESRDKETRASTHPEPESLGHLIAPAQGPASPAGGGCEVSTTGQTLSFPPASSLPGPFQLHPPDVALSPRGFVCLVALDPEWMPGIVF